MGPNGASYIYRINPVFLAGLYFLYHHHTMSWCHFLQSKAVLNTDFIGNQSIESVVYMHPFTCETTNQLCETRAY